jgi:hypothetical protein
VSEISLSKGEEGVGEERERLSMASLSHSRPLELFSIREGYLAGETLLPVGRMVGK